MHFIRVDEQSEIRRKLTEEKNSTHPLEDGIKGDSMRKLNSLATLIAVFGLFFAFGSRQARAESFTMTLTGVGGASAGPYYIYPYDFTIKAGANTFTNVALMCINFDREIYFGETWTANEFTAASLGQNYEEAADLYNQAATGITPDAVSDAQWAAWYLFDPGAGDIDPADGHNVTSLITAANKGYSAYANYDVYLPVPGSQPNGDGIPQIFIGNGEPPYQPTPEPSALLLLATGLLGLASLLYFKNRGVRASAQI
jgi:hypothetical protein